MTDEQRQYFEAMEALFGSLGWSVLEQDVKGMMDAIHTGILTVKPDNLQYEQGRYAGLSQLVAFKQMVENGRAAAEAAPDSADISYEE